MAISLIPKGPNSGSLSVTDGDSPANTLTLNFANGDFSISGLKETLNESTPVEVRGQILGLVQGARVYPTFSFTAVATQLSSATDDNLADFLLRNGVHAANVGTLGAGQPYTVKLGFQIDGTAFGETNQSFACDHCECTLDFSEGSNNQFSISGTIYGDITGDLAATERS